jgi:iron complex outermembrane receptor protein
MKFKTLSVVSSLAVVASLTTPAYAQDDSTGTVDEQQAPQAENRTPDIVVTAEFRERALQDTPIAITAINAALIESRGATDVAQIAAQSPNVTLKPQPQGGGAGLIAYIRGVGQTDFIYARDPGVGVYIDDVYIPTLQSSLIELMDLERIEVLRGPQGTLAGKNSIGGSIRLFGKKPRGDGTGSLEVAYGSFNDMKVRGYGDFAISDNLAVRISGMARNTDGYVKLIDYGLTHPSSNVPTNQSIGRFPESGEMGGRQLVAGRIAFDWQPSDALNVYVTADYTNQDGDPGAAVLIAAGSSGAFNPAGQNPAVDTGGTGTPWLAGKNGAAVTIGCQFVPNGIYSCDTPPSGYRPGFISYANYMDAMRPTPTAPFKPYFAIPKNTFEGWGVHGTVTYDISDDAQLVWISSYRKYESTWAEDQDLTPVGESQLNNINRHWAWSQEVRLNFGLFDDLVEGTVGAFYFDQYGEYEARVDLNYVAAGGPPFLAAPIDFIHGPDQTPSESKAVFTNISVHPTDALTLTGGLRYSDESKDYTYFRRNPDYTPPNAAVCATGPGLTGIRLTSNCALRGFLGTEGNFADTRLDWRAVVDYRFSDALLVYASAATGFKGGGVNPRPFVADQALPFNPETLTTYEAGFKADLLDRRWRLNGAVFFNDYANVQGTKLVCPESSLPSPCLRPANVGQAEMRGFELETSIYPADGLSLDASLAYIDFDWTGPFESAPRDVDNNPATPPTRGPALGDCTDFLQNTSVGRCTVTPYTPKWTYSAGIQYDWEMDAGTLSTRLDGAYQSDVFTTSENSPFSRVDSYFLANGRLAFTTEDEEWQVYLEVKNIFDKYYFLSRQDAGATLGVVTGQPGLPRTWLVGVKKNFGPRARDEAPAYLAPANEPVPTYKQCLNGTVVEINAACPNPPTQVAPPVPPAPQVPRSGENG